MSAGRPARTSSDEAATPQTEPHASLADADETTEIEEIEVEDDEEAKDKGQPRI